MLTPEQFKRACGNLLGIVNSQTTISTKADLGDKSALSTLKLWESFPVVNQRSLTLLWEKLFCQPNQLRLQL